MNELVFYKLLAIFIAVAIGWFVGRMRWLGEADAGGSGGDPARVLSNAAFFIFVPALLFRTTARLDFNSMPWLTLSGFFGPVLLLLFMVYVVQRRRGVGQPEAAKPSVQAITATFGNTLQVGVPLTAGVFGEPGLAILITLISLHALTLLTVLTLLVELDLARQRAGQAGSAQSLGRTLLTTARNTVIHPVMLPVLAGLAWNAVGLTLPAVLNEVLAMLATAVVPLCLTLIGMSLAYYGWPKTWRGVLGQVACKLLVLPALVLVFAHWGLGQSGLPLAVIVIIAALPTGSNALIFAQRYRTMEGETSAVIVISTLLFAVTAPLWLALLSLLN